MEEDGVTLKPKKVKMAEMAEIRAEQKKFSCCSICDSDVIDLGICCDTCERWCHPKCAWISNEEYYRLW